MGAWIETFAARAAKCFSQSHPVWVRGLKQGITTMQNGVKHVAPRVGAWIETRMVSAFALAIWGRTPCGCVD